jgi:alpha-D-ribose 1-methylphosphonate 5-triphosphate synthase subunit PhnL
MAGYCVEVLSYYKLTTSVTDTDVQNVQLYTKALKLPSIPEVDLSKSRGHCILRQSSSFSKKSTLQQCTLLLTVL